MRGSEDGDEFVCLDQQLFQEFLLHNSGLDQALEPEHGFVSFFDDDPDLRNKLGLDLERPAAR